MTPSEPEQPESAEKRTRRQRAEKLLGGLLPDQTRDETADGWGDDDGASRDDELRRDVPPHHGS